MLSPISDGEPDSFIAEFEEKYLRPKVLKGDGDAGWGNSKRVWVKLGEEYALGKTVEQSEQTCTIELEGGNRVSVKQDIFSPVNAPRYDRCEDMAEMPELSEATILHNIKRRYSTNLIHTRSGLFLVIVNPYKHIPIYEDMVLDWYSREWKKGDRPPHIFAVAAEAYRAMLSEGKCQSILITGESGAGKTENTKRVIRFLANCSLKDSRMNGIEERILATNPILEAFGNAQTVRNNNSSRFGKFIKIEFDAGGGIVGASIEKYLLEKGRVTHRSSEERSFHVFYQLLASEDAQQFGLRNQDYKLLCGRRNIESIDDAKEYQVLKSAMHQIGFSESEQRRYFEAIACILLLGDLNIQPSESEEQADIVHDEALEAVITQLGIDRNDFVKHLLNPVLTAGREVISQRRDCEQVKASLEALCRALYERTFSRLLARLNQLISSVKRSTAQKSNTWIGVLDIAGFEIFPENSFEQLCINDTNERLQQFFNHHMFVKEQAEYAKEGLPWDRQDYRHDLQQTIDLIEKVNPVGILACLDEDSLLSGSTDKTFTEKLANICRTRGTNVFQSSRFDPSKRFTLAHYAGNVEYSTQGWLDKNRDPLDDRLFAIVTGGNLSWLVEDESSALVGRSRGTAFRTVAQRHRESLNTLMSHLEQTQPHFVRCILPNTQKLPNQFDTSLVLNQLRCNGVLEGIRICRSGYPARLNFDDFCRLYEILADQEGVMDRRRKSSSETPLPGTITELRLRTKNLLEHLGIHDSDYAVGRTRVFFKAGKLATLDEARDRKLSERLVILQALCRKVIEERRAKRERVQAEAIETIKTCTSEALAIKQSPWIRLFDCIRPHLSITRTQKQIKQLESEIERTSQEYEARIERLHDDLKAEQRYREESVSMRMALEDRINEERREHNALIQAYEEQASLVRALQERNFELGEKFELAEQINALLKQENSEIGENLLTMKIELETQMKESSKLEAETNNFKDLAELLRHELRITKDELQFNVQEISLHRELCKTLKEENEKIKTDAQKTICEIQRTCDAENEKVQLSFEAKLKAERQENQNRNEELCERYEEEKRKLIRELTEARFELEQSRQNSPRINRTKTHETIDEMSQATWQKEKERLEVRIKDLQSQLTESNRVQEDLHQQLAKSSESLRSLKAKNIEIEESNFMLGLTKRSLEDKLKRMEVELSELDDLNEKLCREIKEQAERMNAMESEILADQQEITNLNECIGCKDQEIKALESQAEELLKKLNTVKEEKVNFIFLA